MSISIDHPPLTPGAFVPDPAHPFIPPAFQRLRADRLITRRPMSSRPRILHLTGSLGAGGAERQLVNLVSGLAQRNLDVRVLTIELLEGPSAFHLRTLQNRGISVNAIQRNPEPTLSALGSVSYIDELITQLPNWLKPWPLRIAAELIKDPPDILHIWLDFTNIAGAIAALMTGVPCLILSTRSVNPTHFPYLNSPWFQPWYRFLATIHDLFFINNSHIGQHDYAQWMNVSPSRFQVIRNGIDTSLYQKAPIEEIAAFRKEMNLGSNDRLITGIFRYSEEKRPMMFFDVIESVMLERPNVHTAILGHGPLESEMRARLGRSPCKARIHMLNPRTDMPVVYSASDVVLQTSILEGTPNTLLEAQAAGCPVVTTPAGGAIETLLENYTGFVSPTVAGLAEHVAKLLDDRGLHGNMRARSRRFVERDFGLSRMIDEVISLYRSAAPLSIPIP